MDPITRSHFFSSIYVIQILDPADTERTGELLHKAVIGPMSQAAGVDSQFIQVPHNAALLPALAKIATLCQRRGDSPILHFETHGSPTGMGRTTDPALPYADLLDPLTRINTVSRGNLLVTMAACHGASLVSIFGHARRMPVWALLGPTTLALPSDIRDGFQAFYRALLTSFNLNTALDALRRADRTWPESWYFQPAETLLAIAYGMHSARFDGPGGRRHAERTILKKARRADHKTGRRRPNLRHLIRQWLSQPADPFFDDLKKRFFMADLFPENAARFPITETECLRIFEQWRAHPERGAA